MKLMPITILLGCLITLVACKKEFKEPKGSTAHALVATTSGNAGFKGPKTPSAKPKSPILVNKKDNYNLSRGRFYTKNGAVDGISFKSKDGNTVYLEKSKVKGANTMYNSVTKKGRFFEHEELAEGMSKSQMLRRSEQEKWPDPIREQLKSTDDHLLWCKGSYEGW